MNYFETLGIDKSSSKEEIKEAYDKKVAQIKAEVKNTKNADAFINILKEAYNGAIREKDGIILENENISSDSTMLFSEEDLETIKSSYLKDKIKEKIEDKIEDDYEEDDYEEDDYEDGQVVDLESFYSDGEEEDEEYDDEPSYIEKKVKKKREKIKTKKKTKKKKEKKTKTVEEEEDNTSFKDLTDTGKKSEKIVKEKSKNNNDSNEVASSLLKKILLLPFKILALPIIIILSIIIIILNIMDILVWAISKGFAVVAVSIAAIHAYQIYKGYAMNWKIFAACAVVFTAAVAIPLILKPIIALLKSINGKLKAFVF